MAKLSETYRYEGGSNTALSNKPKLSETYSSGKSVPLPTLNQTTSTSVPSGQTPSINYNKVIKEYESLPDTNIFSRMFSKESKEAYNRKQELNPLYEQAKDLQTKDLLKKYGIADSDIMRQSGNSKKENDRITSLLKSKGITDKATIDAIKGYSERLLNQKVDTNLTEYADEHPYLGGAVSVPLKQASGVTGTVQAGLNFLTGKPMSNSQGAFALNKSVGNMRSKASEDMSGLGKFAYNTGLSIADMAAARRLGNLPAILGLEKATDTMSESIDQGLNPSQILKKGALSGATTALTEKLLQNDVLDATQEAVKSLLRQGGVKALGKEGVRSILLPLLAKSSLGEGAQEGLENIADALADLWVAKGDNQFKKAYDNYKANGDSDGEAIKKVAWDYIKDLGLDIAGGTISGLVMGGTEMGTSALDYNINNRGNKNIPTLENNNQTEQPTQTEVPTAKENLEVQQPTVPQNPIREAIRNADADTKADLRNFLSKYNELSSEDTSLQGALDSIYGDQNVLSRQRSEQLESLKDEYKAKYPELFDTQTNTPLFSEADLMVPYDVPSLPTIQQPTSVDLRGADTQTTIPSVNEETSVQKPTESRRYTDNEIADIQSYKNYRDRLLKMVQSHPELATPAYFDVINRMDEEMWQKYPEVFDNGNFKGVPTLEEEAPKKRDKLMLEDVGLNDHAEDYDDSPFTLTVDARNLNGVPNLQIGNQQTTRTARNTLEKFYSQNDEAYERHVKNVYDEKYQYEIKNLKQVDDGARNTIVKYGPDSVYEDIIHDGIKTIDDFAKARNLQNWYESRGEYEKVDMLSQKISQGLTPAAQMMRYCQVYGDSPMGVRQSTDALAGQVTKAFVNDAEKKTGNRKNKQKLEINKKLASALSKMGETEQTEQRVVKPKTYDELFKEVSNTLPTGEYDGAEIAYITRMIQNGATVQDLVDALNRHAATGYFGMSQEDMNAINDLYEKADEAKSSKERFDYKMQAAAIASKYVGKATFMDKWNAWRYLAMLGNPRTWIRNKFGNRSFGFVTNVKDNVAALIENAVIKDGEGRTKAILNKNTDADLIKAANKDFNDYAYEHVAGTSKWSMKSNIENARRIFDNRLLEKARNYTNEKLEGDDLKAIQRKYTRALAGYLKANGAGADIFNSDIESDFLNEARAYAIEQAKIATFHDDNKTADLLNKWSNDARKMGGVTGKAFEMAIESTMPFKKTPMNVLKQGVIEYSPAQLLKAAYQIKTKQDASQWIDSLAKGLTGSTIMAIGYALGQSGVLVGQVDDDDDDLYNKGSNYSIKLPNGTSFTIDWLAPAALPLFVGNELAEAFGGEWTSPADFIEALASVGEPAVELSMLEGLDNTLSSLANIKGAKLAPTIANIAAGYASQGIPTIVGQVARTIDPYRRSTRTTDSSSKNPVAAVLEKTGEKVINKLPFLSMTNQKYIDRWGEPQKNANGLFEGDTVGRAIQNFVSPGYFNDISMTEREEKLATLEKDYKANDGKGSLIPALAPSNKPDGTRMTNDEYEKYSETRGKEMGEAVDAALKYQGKYGIKDSELETYIKKAENVANAIANNKEFKKDISDTYKKAYEAYKLNGYDGVIAYYMMLDKADLDGSDSISQEELAEWLRKSPIPAQYRKQFFKIKFPKAKEIPRLH